MESPPSRGSVSTPPDLILLDWQMPRLDGLFVCRAIRGTSDVPIIMVTCKRPAAGRYHALAAGANDYLAKPFVMDDLLARIEALLSVPNGSANKT